MRVSALIESCSLIHRMSGVIGAEDDLYTRPKESRYVRWIL